MKRSLGLKKETLVELGTADLASVVGAGVGAPTLPVNQCALTIGSNCNATDACQKITITSS
ncbi:MAG TPA: hypothetical protein VFQ85_13580 [Mycobacteriales bacterium]|jgi:hypothetical protein|nr:hypothetical protein [Mycobacteriales bacterium]